MMLWCCCEQRINEDIITGFAWEETIWTLAGVEQPLVLQGRSANFPLPSNHELLFWLTDPGGDARDGLIARAITIPVRNYISAIMQFTGFPMGTEALQTYNIYCVRDDGLGNAQYTRTNFVLSNMQWIANTPWDPGGELLQTPNFADALNTVVNAGNYTGQAAVHLEVVDPALPTTNTGRFVDSNFTLNQQLILRY